MSDPKPRIACIGTGLMGAPMAMNLIKAGYDVLVHNRTQAKAQALLDAGATWCDTPRACIEQGARIVCINVNDTPDVQRVVTGDDGLLRADEAMLRDLVIVDHSTIDPNATVQLAEQCRAANVAFVDAPVSGGDVGAINGTLSIMIGGDNAAVQKAWPLFEVVGKTLTHVGRSGAGQWCKACNQVAVVCNLMGVCEAMTLAKKAGIDVGKMLQVLSGGAAGSWQLSNLGSRIAEGDFAPGFKIDLMLKDLGIVADAARSLNVPLTGTGCAEALFRAERADGGAERGTQAIARVLATLAGVTWDASRQ